MSWLSLLYSFFYHHTWTVFFFHHVIKSSISLPCACSLFSSSLFLWFLLFHSLFAPSHYIVSQILSNFLPSRAELQPLQTVWCSDATEYLSLKIFPQTILLSHVYIHVYPLWLIYTFSLRMCSDVYVWFFLKGDKLSMLKHTYQHKPLRKIKWPSAITRLIALLYVWPDVWSGDL